MGLALPSLTFQEPKRFGAEEVGGSRETGKGTPCHPNNREEGVLSTYMHRHGSHGITLTDGETEALRGPRCILMSWDLMPEES